ncbi:Uncharacterised protein [Mycobacteroides abscessus subsp. abscessus]|nr:Uncharacterised protein [Mycobacteroides abscessus subsp. abscessus]
MRQAEIARHKVSSENGSRSSTLPPPRANTITSTEGSASSACRAATISATACGPCTGVLRIANCTAGQRVVATEVTSCSAALARPVMSPMRAGRNGTRRFKRASKSPSAASS